MIEEIQESGLKQSIVTSSVRLTFSWSGDRWVHSLELPGKSGQSSLLMQSVDHTADPEAPTPPAYQQLHLQREGDSFLAMLVGQSGPHHFSAAFTIREDAKRLVSIEADIADRRSGTGGPSGPLACTYEVALPVGEIEAGDESLIQWNSPAHTGRLSLLGAQGVVGQSIVSLAERGVSRSLVQFVSLQSGASSTVRCGYRWTWEPTPA